MQLPSLIADHMPKMEVWLKFMKLQNEGGPKVIPAIPRREMVTILRIFLIESDPMLSIHVIIVNRAMRFAMKARQTAARLAFLKASM